MKSAYNLGFRVFVFINQRTAPNSLGKSGIALHWLFEHMQFIFEDVSVKKF